ncbi:VHS1024 protein [Vibrio phage 1]|nr:VHS1024 protein [Vibrio phage 1]
MTDNAKLSELIYHSFTALDCARHVALNAFRAEDRSELLEAIAGARAAVYAIQVASRHEPILGNIRTDRAGAALHLLMLACEKREQAAKRNPDGLVLNAILSLCAEGKLQFYAFLAELNKQ